MKKKFLLLIITLIFLVIILEGVLKIFYPQNLGGWYSERDYAGLNILKKNLIYHHRINNRNIKYTFGSFNNRITTKNNYNKENKILILGDSFTFGWLVNDDHIFVNHLQNYYKKYFFINPSVPGWGTSDYVRFTENYCNKIKPNKIIVMLNTDDFSRAWLSNLYKFKITDLENINENLVELGFEKQLNYNSKYHKIPFYKFFVSNSHLFVLIRQVVVDLKNKNFNLFKKFQLTNEESKNEINKYKPSQTLGEDYLKGNILGKILLLRLKDISVSCGSELIVIYSGWWDYKNNHHEYNPTLYFLNGAKTFFKKNNIKYYDFVEEMKNVHQNYSEYSILNDGHPNELAHRIIADKIIKKLFLH